MALWRLVATLPTGEGLVDLTDATDVKITWRLTEPSTIDWKMPGDHPATRELVELGTDVIVFRDGERLLRARMHGSADSLDEDRHEVTFQATDYRGLLNRRILTAPYNFAGSDQSAIAWFLILVTQAQTGGHMGISRGIGAVTGRNRDRNYEAGKSVGEALNQLSEVIDGFDWDISPALTFDIYYPQRGAVREFVAHYGSTVSRLARTVDPSTFANAVRFTGADDGPTAEVRVAADIASRREGRWDLQVGDPDITVQSTVAQRAEALLAASEDLQPSYTATIRPGHWAGPASLWIGDTCRLVIDSGRLDVDTDVRVHELTVDLGDDGDESVSCTFNRPAPSLIRRIAGHANRLTNLEKR